MIAGERFYPVAAVNFTMAEQREFYERYCAHFRKPRPSGITTEDFSRGTAACHIYRPKREMDYPVLPCLHDGGYVLGGLESHDNVCAEIIDRGDLIMIGVHYRLAPENPFRTALDDAWAMLHCVS
jgi:acetyl esterase